MKFPECAPITRPSPPLDTLFSYAFRYLPVVRFSSNFAHIFYSLLPVVVFTFIEFPNIFFFAKYGFSVSVLFCCLIRLKLCTHLLLVITQGLFFSLFRTFSDKNLKNLFTFLIFKYFRKNFDFYVSCDFYVLVPCPIQLKFCTHFLLVNTYVGSLFIRFSPFFLFSKYFPTKIRKA